MKQLFEQITSTLYSVNNIVAIITCVPERRAAIDQSYGPGDISIPSISKFCLAVMKYLYLPLETEHIKV